MEAVSPVRCNLLALGSEALSTHGLPSPSRFSSPQGCHKTWTWSPLALHLPCKGQNPSVPRVPVEEGGKAGGGGWSKIKGMARLNPKAQTPLPRAAAMDSDVPGSGWRLHSETQGFQHRGQSGEMAVHCLASSPDTDLCPITAAASECPCWKGLVAAPPSQRAGDPESSHTLWQLGGRVADRGHGVNGDCRALPRSPL